jgi:gamma-glutamylaminecyclotransferase
MTYRVFVYGSLLSGLHNHHCLRGAKFVADAETAPGLYQLLSLGAFPGLIHKPAAGAPAVCGEVYDVDQDTLDTLDRLEGNGHFYNRDVLRVHTLDGKPLQAWAYLLSAGAAREHPSIPSGCWRAHLAERGQPAC